MVEKADESRGGEEKNAKAAVTWTGRKARDDLKCARRRLFYWLGETRGPVVQFGH